MKVSTVVTIAVLLASLAMARARCGAGV